MAEEEKVRIDKWLWAVRIFKTRTLAAEECQKGHVTIGGVLIDPFGTINGVAHTGQKTENGQDLFLPTETALRSVGLSICEKLYDRPSPWQKTVYKPVTEKILSSTPKAPEVLAPQERK